MGTGEYHLHVKAWRQLVHENPEAHLVATEAQGQCGRCRGWRATTISSDRGCRVGEVRQVRCAAASSVIKLEPQAMKARAKLQQAPAGHCCGTLFGKLHVLVMVHLLAVHCEADATVGVQHKAVLAWARTCGQRRRGTHRPQSHLQRHTLLSRWQQPGPRHLQIETAPRTPR